MKPRSLLVMFASVFVLFQGCAWVRPPEQGTGPSSTAAADPPLKRYPEPTLGQRQQNKDDREDREKGRR